MKKAGLKTFVVSFVFSLSAIIGAERVFFVEKKQENAPLNISEKNISLFFKNTNPVSVRTRKIELVKLEDIEEPEILLSEDDVVQPDIFVAENFEEPINDDAENLVLAELLPPLEEVLEAKVVEEIEVTKSIVYDGEAVVEKNTVTEDLVLAEVVYDGSAESEPAISEVSNEELEKKDIVYAANESFEAVEEPVKETEIATAAVVELVSDEDDSGVIPLERGNRQPSTTNKDIRIVKEMDRKQLAMASNKLPINNIDENVKKDDISEKESKAEKEWISMEQKSKKNESPWVVAKGSKYPKNSAVLQEAFSRDISDKELNKLLSGNHEIEPEKNVETAEIARNILIPIPDEIMEEGTVVPRLMSDGAQPPMPRQTETVSEEKSEEKGIFRSLSAIFSSSSDKSKAAKKDSSFIDKITDTISGKDSSKPLRILPTEMRLAFQPNRAEISGQTLKWIQAFAKKAADDDSVVLEIRIDGTSSHTLQQRRLNLLQNILLSRGAPRDRVKVVFTAREPNSFILRTLRNETNETEEEKRKKMSRATSPYYQRW